MPRYPVGFDADHHALRDEPGLGVEVIIGQMLGDELVQPGQPGDSLG
jgi:hypothetical protein